MIKITIDGKEFEAEQGKTVWQIAKDNGIEIPILCYNEKISHTTSCLVCCVKNLQNGRNIPSCATVATDGMQIEAMSDDLLKTRKTLLNLLLSEHNGDCEAPCTIACPAQAAVEEYVREGRKGKFLESLKIIKERIPLPMSIGRVCPRFCEKDCRRNIIDEAVAINDFKRLAADLHYDEYMEELPELTGKKVAIVGGGPAGLGTAYYLRREGITPVIFEKEAKGGGMLRYGIPEYRLPKDILDKELAHFAKMGIDFKYNTTIGKDISMEDLKKDYDAVVVSIGCWEASSMRTKGEELADEGIVWLGNIARNGWNGDNPGKTIVIGGGNTAMDCVRTSIRLGSDDVSCVYRRTEKEMPAEEIEIEEAKEEGVNFEFLTAPISLRKDNDKLILTCQKMELGEADASGRRRPVPVADSNFDIEADTVITAIGQRTAEFAGANRNKWGNLDASEKNCQVEDNVFACGDCATGAATVVEAVAGARKTAIAIIDFFNNAEHKEPYLINVSRGHWNELVKDDLVFLNDLNDKPRTTQTLISIEDRKSTFAEVAATFTEDEIKEEGKRCIECSCTAKTDCKLKSYSEEYNASPTEITGEKLKHGYDVRNPYIIQDKMKCIKCGVCVKICHEVINESLLGRQERGFFTTVGTAHGNCLPDSCKECGACIPECPVGALDWKNK